MEADYPPTCASGHPPRGGLVTYSWVFCDCPGAFGGGHHLRLCWQGPDRHAACDRQLPDEHTGPLPDQR